MKIQKIMNPSVQMLLQSVIGLFIIFVAVSENP